MSNLQRTILNTIDRIYCGETVPVKKEFQNIVAEELDSHKVPYCIVEDATNGDRIIFRRTAEQSGTVPD